MPQWYASSAIEDSSQSSRQSFRERMLRRMKKQENIRRPITQKSKLVKEVQTLKEYKKVVVEQGNGSFVVVWFYTHWCKACKATGPGYFALAKHHPEMKFLKVPVTKDNATLHQGLGVPKVPYVHLYHPNGLLVEEQKLTRKLLPGFHKMLRDYQNGQCSLEQGKGWSTKSPYEPAPKAKDEE